MLNVIIQTSKFNLGVLVLVHKTQNKQKIWKDIVVYGKIILRVDTFIREPLQAAYRFRSEILIVINVITDF